MELWITLLLSGISFAAVLFILSSGFTLAFGLMKIVNIAHGSFYLLAAYIALSVWNLTGNFFLVIAASSLSLLILGVVAQKWFLRRFYLQPLPQTLFTMGMVIVIADLCLVIWGGHPRVMDKPVWLSGATRLSQTIYYPTYRLFAIAVSAGVAICLWGLLEKTKTGAFVRACVDDEEMARAMGVNVERLFMFMFGFSAFLAGLGGAIGAPFIGAYQGADFEVLLPAVVIVILGGLGSLGGALIGSLFIGIIDSLGKGLFPELAHFTLFAPMIIVLAVKPTGLLGRE